MALIKSEQIDITKQSLLANHCLVPKLSWFAPINQSELIYAMSTDLPDAKTPTWKFANSKLLRDKSYQEVKHVALTSHQLAPHCQADAIRLVFVNGVFALNLSDFKAFAQQINLSPLVDNEIDSEIKDFVASGVNGGIFTALNNSFCKSATLIKINGTVAPLIHILNITCGDGQSASVCYPRMVVMLDKNGEAAIFEEYVDLTAGNLDQSNNSTISLTVALTEMFLAKNSKLKHVALINSDHQEVHVGKHRVCINKDAIYQFSPLILGARMSHLIVEVDIVDEGARAEITGATVINQRQNASLSTQITHHQANSKSNQLQKTVVDNFASAAFNGKIIVGKNAVLTDAKQQSKSLILTDKAAIEVEPQLEINNNDVVCSHGATISQLNDDVLFFLQSRGIDKSVAKDLLKKAFIFDVIKKIEIDAVRNLLMPVFKY